MTTEQVDGYYVLGVSDGSWLVALDENANAVLGRVYPVGDWWVSLRHEPDLTDIFPDAESLSPEDTELLKAELLRRAETYRHGPNAAGWGRSRDDAVARFRAPVSESD